MPRRQLKYPSYRILIAILFLVISLIIFLARLRQKPTPIEATWAPTASSWSNRKQLTITNNSGASLSANTTYSLTLNTKDLYDSGLIQSDCADIRVYYQPDSSTATKLDYYIETPSDLTCATSTTTTIHFPLQADLSNNSTSPYYYLYLSNSDATSESSISAFDIGDKNATFYCGFKSSTTCINTGGTVPPTTASGAIRYSSPSALSFDGNTNSFSVPSSGSLGGLQTWTVEFWVNSNRWSATSTPTEWMMTLGAGYLHRFNGLRWYLSFSGQGLNPTIYQKSSSYPTAGEWHHFAISYDGSTVRTFTNGQQVGSASYSGTPYSTGSTIRFSTSGANYWQMKLDELRVSTTARYTSNFTPQTTPFVRDEFTKALYHFDENGDDPRNSGKAIDDSGNNNHGTITGAKYVSGIVGINSSTLDSGTLPSQSYASHGGIFLEEGTTNLITNPSFEHSTYDTNWGLPYENLGDGTTTFTPAMSKRNSHGPFATGIFNQSNTNIGSTGDSITYSAGNYFQNLVFFDTFDRNQGSIVMWVTPEWDGNDGIEYDFFSASGTNIWTLRKTTSNQLSFELGWGVNVSQDVSNWQAGNTYLIIVRWDFDTPLNNTNRYLSMTINQTTNYMGSLPSIHAWLNATQKLGSYNGANSANAIIEGFTIYRRPLYTVGTGSTSASGINIGNGDEIEQIYNSSAGKDPTLITGSWDVVFALPTNSSTGSLGVGGTGQAWSHPHSSNVLYTSSTNTGGFMMGVGYTADGWSDEGTPSSIATTLAPSEKIYSGGYKWDSDDYNEGIKYTLSGLTAGQNYVVRAVANSADGTGQPKIFIYDETNGADITSFTGTIGSGRTAPDVMLFTFELPTTARNGVASDCTSISVKLVNASNSGSVHFHQIELLTNKIDNPSMETGSGDPWLPSGYSTTEGGADSGESSQSSTAHSGNYALKFTTSSSSLNVLYSHSGTIGNFYSLGGWMRETNGSQTIGYGENVKRNDGASNLTLYASGDSYSHYSGVFMKYGAQSTKWVRVSSTTNTTSYVDDIYSFELNNVSLSVTPASQANSTETTGLRVDGADTLTQSVSNITSTQGSLKFKFTPRHNFDIGSSFGYLNPVIFQAYGDGDDYIKVYKSGNNLIALASFAGTTVPATWPSPTLNAGTTYPLVISYATGSNLTLSVGNSLVATASIGTGSSFSTTPTTAYFGSDASGTNQYDCTITNFEALTPTQNTTTPYYIFGSNSTKLISINNDEFAIPINVGSTAVHTLSAYVYDYTTGNIGGTISSSVAQLVFNGSAIGTTYTDTGGGWWRLSVGATAGSGSQNYGVQVKSGKTVYIDGVQLEQKTYQTTYADGSLGIGYTWTGTANDSICTRTAVDLKFSDTNNFSASAGTISFWVKSGATNIWNDNNSHSFIFMPYNGLNYIRKHSSNLVQLYWGGSNLLFDSSAYTSDKWYHIVSTWDNSTNSAKLYVNNSAPQTGTYSSISTGDFAIGNQSGINYMDANFSDFRIFDSAITADEISSLYYSGLASHQLQTNHTSRYTDGQPPVSYWKLDEGIGSTLNDSISTNHGSLSTGDSAPTWASGSACVSNNCLSFDGTSDYATISSTITGLRGISFWLKPTATTTSVLGLNSTQTISITNNVISANGLSSPTIYVNGQNTTSLNPDEWSHILITSSTSFAVSGMTLGKVSTNYFSGYLDEIKLYSFIPTDSEIKKDINLGYSSSFGQDPETDQITPLKSKLIAHYKFDEGYSTTAHDTVGSNHGTFGTGSSAPTWTTNGKVGKALSFSSNQYISAGTGPSLNGTSDLTVSAWIKTNSSNGDFIISQRDTVGYNGQYMLNLDYSGRIQFNLYGDSAYQCSSVGVTSVTIVNNDAWHRVVGQRQSNNLNIYVDGKLESTCTGTVKNLNNTINTSIGGNIRDNNRFFNGLVDEVKIYNYSLSDSEILQDYNQGMAAVMGKSNSNTGSTAPAGSNSQEYCIPGDSSPCSPPVAEWNFDEGVGTTAFDISGNNNHGVFGSGSSAPSWTMGKIGTGLNFDGNDFIDLGTNSKSYLSDSASYSVSFWIKTNSTTRQTVLGSYSGTSAAGLAVEINRSSIFDDSGFIFSFNRDSIPNSLNGYTSITTNVNDGNWHHVTQIVDTVSNTISIFLDGQGKVTTYSSSGNINNLGSLNNNIYLGANNNQGTPGSNLTGLIDQVRIYNYARTPAQIAWDYNRGAPIAHYKMDETEGSIAYNSSDNSHATLSSGSSAPSRVSGKLNDALSFDGNDYVSVGSTLAVQSISFWAKPNSTTQYPLQLNSSNNIQLSSGTVSVTGFGTPTIYIDGVLSTSFPDTNWHHITIVSSTSLTADQIFYGRIGSNFYSGLIDDIRLYSYGLTQDQVKQIYNNGAVTFR